MSRRVFIMMLLGVGVLFVMGAQSFASTGQVKPNIVLIAIDTLRRDHLGCYGYSRKTSPHIDTFASQGVLFRDCHSPASWTLPSFMSMFTGLMPSSHGVVRNQNKLLSSIPTIPEKLKEKGYYCVAVVSNPCVAGKYGFSRGFDIYDDYSVFLGAELGIFQAGSIDDRGAVNEMVTGSNVTQQAEQLLQKCKASNKPFFLFVLYFDPHDSYIPPAPYDRMFDPDYQGKMDGRGIPSYRKSPPPSRDIQHLMARYDGEITYTDHQIGRLLKQVEKVSPPGKTLVIVVADHGEAFGEHGMMLHGNSAYREETCVPMIWRWKGVIPEGKEIAGPVLSLDIPKTICELLHLKGLSLLQGKSLWPVLRKQKSVPERVVVTEKACGANNRDHHLVITGQEYRLHVRFQKDIEEKDRILELYQWRQDPWETKNVIKEQAAIAQALLQQLVRRHKESEEIHTYFQKRSKGKQKLPMTDAERRQLKTMGYINDGGK